MTATIAEVIDRYRVAEATRPVETIAAAPARRRSSRLWRARHDIGFVSLALTLITVLHARMMYVSPARFDDEGTYVAQAWAVQQGRGLAHYTYWYDHPPLGWLQLALMDWIVDPLTNAPNAVSTGRVVMLLFKMALGVALYVLGRRLGYARMTCALAIVAFGASPLAIVYQRMVYLDNIAAFWVIVAFMVAARRELTTARAALAGALFGVGVLSKETVLLIVPALAVLVWQRVHPSVRRFGMTLFVVSVSLTVLLYPLLAVLRNELFPGDGHVSLWDGVNFQLFERKSNGPVWDTSTGAFKQIEDWFYLDGVLLYGALFATVPALFVRRLRAIAIAVAIQLLAPLRGGYLPGPYVILIIPFAAILVCGLAEEGWRILSGRRNAKSETAKVVRLGKSRVAAASLCIVGVLTLSATHASSVFRDRVFVNHDTAMTSAQRWLQTNATTDDVMIVDDAIWLDLVEGGFDPDNVVWFWKVDTDITFEEGWRSIDYAVLGINFPEAPTIMEFLAHAVPVAEFGKGVDRLTVYKAA